ncbi:cytochrome P450 family protein [Streptomyces humi]
MIDLSVDRQTFTADPYAVYATLREQGPVHFVRLPGGRDVWLVVGYDEARAALTDPRLSKNWQNSAGWTSEPEAIIGTHMLNTDAPDHTRLRRLVAKEFTARRTEALRPRIQQIADELLDAFPASGHTDLVDAFAFPLPIAVICDLLGVPDLDRNSFRTWSNAILAPATADDPAPSPIVSMRDYLTQLIDHKRRQPGDDLLSALIETTDDDGDRLSPDELRAMAFLLLVAGHETTVNLISNAVLALLTHPEQLAALRDDWTLLESTVEEVLRYDGPLKTATYRFATEPLTIGEATIPRHAPVLVALAAADRDTARFSQGDSFNIRRAANGHLAFGHGLHHCLGAPLARLEGQIALRSLFQRHPGLSLNTDPAELLWQDTDLTRGVHALPVRYTPQPDMASSSGIPR